MALEHDQIFSSPNFEAQGFTNCVHKGSAAGQFVRVNVFDRSGFESWKEISIYSELTCTTLNSVRLLPCGNGTSKEDVWVKTEMPARRGSQQGCQKDLHRASTYLPETLRF